MLYQRKQLSNGAGVGDPAALPVALIGLSDASLADLQGVLKPCPPEWADAGFFPVDDAPAAARTLVVDVPTFLLRLSPAERVQIRASQNDYVGDFQRLLDDPRVLRINLALPAVQQAVGYLAGLGGDPPLSPAILTPDRVAAILAPEPV